MKKIIIGIASCLVLFTSCFDNTEDMKKENRIYRTGDQYFVVYNGNTFELPKDLQLTKSKKLEQYFTKGILRQLHVEVINESELLNDLNKYFPGGVKHITENEEGKATVELPITTVGNEKHIDSIKFEKVLAGLQDLRPKNAADSDKGENTTVTNTNINPAETLKGKKIEILNANGINGFAKNIGEKLQNTYGITFNAENYSKDETMNYVIVRKFNEAEVQAILETANIKYARVLEDSNVKPEADFVLITGNDNEIKFKLEVATLGDTSIVTEKLNGYKPEIVKSTTFAEEPIDKMTQIQVVYNKADLYTAKLIAKRIGGNVKMVESEKMNNRIVVVSKN